MVGEPCQLRRAMCQPLLGELCMGSPHRRALHGCTQEGKPRHLPTACPCHAGRRPAVLPRLWAGGAGHAGAQAGHDGEPAQQEAAPCRPNHALRRPGGSPRAAAGATVHVQQPCRPQPSAGFPLATCMPVWLPDPPRAPRPSPPHPPSLRWCTWGWASGRSWWATCRRSTCCARAPTSEPGLHVARRVHSRWAGGGGGVPGRVQRLGSLPRPSWARAWGRANKAQQGPRGPRVRMLAVWPAFLTGLSPALLSDFVTTPPQPARPLLLAGSSWRWTCGASSRLS